MIHLLRDAISGRRAHMHSRSMERFKSAVSVADSELRCSIDAVNRGIRSIQALKDVIWVIAQSVPSSARHDELTSALSDAVQDVISSFDDGDPFLTRGYRRPFHFAKDVSLKLRELLRSHTDLSNISDGLRQEVMNIRRDLTDAQSQLRDLKFDTLLRLNGLP